MLLSGRISGGVMGSLGGGGGPLTLKVLKSCMLIILGDRVYER